MTAAVEPADLTALQALSYRYARAADRRNAADFVGLFTEGARLRMFNPAEAEQPTAMLSGHDELAQVPKRLDTYARTFHLVGNATYEVDGDDATGEVYCEAHHLIVGADGSTDLVLFIRYRRVAGAWAIDDRQVLVDWLERRPGGTS